MLALLHGADRDIVQGKSLIQIQISLGERACHGEARRA